MKSIFLPNIIKNKRIVACLLIILITNLAVFSCKQSSIFYGISNEVAPKDPRISGAPSAMVAFKQKLYVARRSLYSYGDGQGTGNASTWDKIDHQPPVKGDIVYVAATANDLFVQSVSPFELYQSPDGSVWNKVLNNTDYDLQSIYAVDDQLFASGVDRDSLGREDYAILWYDGTHLVSLKEDIGENGRLTGAVHIGSDYYLATLGGIYVLSTPSLGALSATAALPTTVDQGYITGLIADIPQTSLLALSTEKGEDARIFTASAAGTSTSFVEKEDYSNVRFNGGMNIAHVSGNYILMVCYESVNDNYNFGYREIVLNADGSFPAAEYNLNIPGESVRTTITYNDDAQDQYESSLRREVVSSIIQTPSSIDANQILFASTYRMGLWSYRDNEWNAEE